MTAAGILFTFGAVLLQFVLPRRYALLPLLIAMAWMTRGQALDLGGLNFTVLRLVIAVGLVRVALRQEQIAGGLNRVDLWILVWTLVLLATAPFHASGAFVFRLGMAWDYLGGYYLARVFLQNADDITRAFKALCLLFVPVAVAMLVEKHSNHNVFSVLGGVPEISAMREGKLRATGPFSHPILAGTVGAALIPMALAIRKAAPLPALCGLVAGIAMVWASASSGPVLMEFFIVFALLLHRFRRHLSAVRWLAVLGIVCLAAVMNDPVYFLMAKLDFAGGSTGWFRSQLIRSGIEHLDEWWLFGTDRTIHWMPTGNPANAGHTDITNQYLQMGVWGGLALIAVFVKLLLAAFAEIGAALKRGLEPGDENFVITWTVGAILFGYAMNFLSVVLFDQSNLCFLMLLGAVGTLRSHSGASSPVLEPSKAELAERRAAARAYPWQLPTA